MRKKYWVYPGFLVLVMLLLLSFPVLAVADDGINKSVHGEIMAIPVHDSSSGEEVIPVPESGEPVMAEPGAVEEEPAPAPEEPVEAEPSVVDEKPAPAPEEPVKPEPSVVEEKPAPALEEPVKPEPSVVDEKPAPALEEPVKPESSVIEEKPAPAPEEPVKPEPSVVDEKPAPAPEEPVKPESSVIEEKPAPALEEPVKPESSVVDEKPAPAPEEPVKPESSVIEEKPAPAPEEPVKPEPSVVEEKPAPALEEPVKPESSVIEEKPAPAPEEPVKPEPSVVEEKPAPALEEPVKPESSVIEEKPAPAPEEPVKPEPSVVEEKPAPALEEPVKPKLDAVEKKPAPAPEEPVKPEPSVVDEKPTPAPEEPVKPEPSVVDEKPALVSWDNEKVPVVEIKPVLSSVLQEPVIPRANEILNVASPVVVEQQAGESTIRYAVGSGDTIEEISKKTVLEAQEPFLTYLVRRGESLWLIGRSLGVLYQDIMRANNLTGHIIYPDQKLIIPGLDLSREIVSYRIKSGDTFYLIGKALGVNFTDIMSLNGSADTWIYPDDEYQVPMTVTANLYREKEGTESKNELLSMFSMTVGSDFELLARAIHGEARGESYEGQVAVGAVIMNRLKSLEFPNSIREIIYQPRAFTAVDDGQINLTPNDSAYRAARDAMDGADPSLGANYYWNPELATSKWIWTRPIIKHIGKHVFAR